MKNEIAKYKENGFARLAGFMDEKEIINLENSLNDLTQLFESNKKNTSRGFATLHQMAR